MTERCFRKQAGTGSRLFPFGGLYLAAGLKSQKVNLMGDVVLVDLTGGAVFFLMLPWTDAV